MVGVATRYPKSMKAPKRGSISRPNKPMPNEPPTAFALALERMDACPQQLHHPAVTGYAHHRVHSRPSSALAERARTTFFSGAASSIWRVINATTNLGAKRCAAIRSARAAQWLSCLPTEWQSLGSLHRRLQDCESGARAQTQELGSDAILL